MMLAGSRARVRAKSLHEFRRLSPALLLLLPLVVPDDMAGLFSDVCAAGLAASTGGCDRSGGVVVLGRKHLLDVRLFFLQGCGSIKWTAATTPG